MLKDEEMNRLIVVNLSRSSRHFSTKKPPKLDDSLSTVFPREMPSFTSPLNLSKIYPKSNLDPFTPPKDLPHEPKSDSFNGFIPMNKLTVTYAGSGGPGGQHMQKSHTKVCVSFHLESADWIPESARAKLALLVRLIVSYLTN